MSRKRGNRSGKKFRSTRPPDERGGVGPDASYVSPDQVPVRDRSRASTSRRLTRGRLTLLLLVALLAMVAAVLVIRRPRGPLPVSTDPFPPPTTAVATPVVDQSQFIGSDRCAECHEAQVDAWRRSTHAKAGGTPGSVRVVAPFNGTPMRFSDATVIPASAGSTITFTVQQAGTDDRVFRVDAVVGGGHMQGGGSQGFLSRYPDGTLRFLPFDFSRTGNTWFCNTIARGGKGWVPVTTALSITDCVDWPPVRILGDEPRFSNCQSCHGSQIRVSLDTIAQRYKTEIASLGITCEACHGPGAPHLARLRDPASVARGDIGMTALAALDKDGSLGTCWQCHALKDQVKPGFVSGLSLPEFYSIRLPQLGDNAHFPDGRVRTFAYQEGHLWSDCYRNGGMTCTSCHDPHTQEYRDVTGSPIPGRFDDRQCTSCHASKADSSIRHTRHAPDSPGSRCTSCHMPYLQEPELGEAIPFRRSDHTIPIPRPAADAAMGIQSACIGCHSDRSEAALDSIVRQWYGELKPLPAAVANLQRAQQTDRLTDAARLVLDASEKHTQGLFTGMAWFVDRYVKRDMQDLDGEVIERLEALATHPDDDIAALALAALHTARGTVPDTRAFLIQTVQNLGAREPAVRARWSIILGYLADRARGAGDAAGAIVLYERALEVDPASVRIPVNLGLALVDAGNATAAVNAYRASLNVSPAQPLTLVNLGIALGRANDAAGAMSAYRRAMELNPREPLAWFNMAALFARQSLPDSAIAYFHRAAELDPSLSLARFYAAGIYLQKGDAASALRDVEAGLRFDPDAVDAIQLRDQLRQALGARQP